MQGYDSAFRVWRILGGGKIRQTLCVLNLAKILLNNSFFYIGGGGKFIKGVFARFRPPQPPVVIHRRNSGGWEAESFLDAWRGYNTPPTQSSLCARGSSLAAFACLRSKPAFPSKISKNILTRFRLDTNIYMSITYSKERQCVIRPNLLTKKQFADALLAEPRDFYNHVFWFYYYVVHRTVMN